MSLVGSRRELHSVTQYPYQFVIYFEGRVGRVWAFCVAGISHCLSAAPFAKSELSRPWDITVHAADASLSRKGVAALTAPLAVVKSVGSISERWRFKGPMRASGLDLLNLTDF